MPQGDHDALESRGIFDVHRRVENTRTGIREEEEEMLPLQKELDQPHSHRMFLIIFLHKILLCYTFAAWKKKNHEMVKHDCQEEPYPSNHRSIGDIQLENNDQDYQHR